MHTLVTVLLLLLVLGATRAHELCLDGSAPSLGAGTFATCSAYDGVARCVQPADEAAEITTPLAALGLAAGACLDDFMEPMYCARADPWTAHLFDAEAGPARTVPILCNAFATGLYAACASASMTGNPFLTGGATGTIASQFATEAAFLAEFAPSDSTYCFDGAPYELPPPVPFSSSEFLCVERLSSNAGWINAVPIPGFTDMMLLGTQTGVAQIAQIRAPGLAPVILGSLADFSSFVTSGGERGLLGVAFHKDFAANGRIFISYSCGNVVRCGATGTSVIEEFEVANPTNAATMTISSLAAGRVIMTAAQPYDNHNGGQLLFRPGSSDPHLYWFLGDGGSGGDPENRAQNMLTVLGKVLRIDIDSAPTGGREYAIPSDNPFVPLGDATARPEIWAVGLRNPWRCSFDRDNAAYLYCGDVGQNGVEEVSLIAKGGNYGWRRFEGANTFNGGTALALGMTHTLPVIQYTHAFNAGVAASITGGFMYRGTRVPELQGSYIFGDLYDRLYVSRESPPLSGNFDITRYSYACSTNSPEPCQSNVNFLTSFGEDNQGDLFFLAGNGFYRVLDYNSCPTPSPSSAPSRSPSLSPSMSSAAAVATAYVLLFTAAPVLLMI